jgi:hypothetical protein
MTWKQAAERAGMKFTDWIEVALDKAAVSK